MKYPNPYHEPESLADFKELFCLFREKQDEVTRHEAILNNLKRELALLNLSITQHVERLYRNQEVTHSDKQNETKE